MTPFRALTLDGAKHTLLRTLTLRRKIFLALTALTVTLLVVFISLLRSGLHRNLGDYVAEIELSRMDWFVHKLEQSYTTRGNWDFLNQDAWQQLQHLPHTDDQGRSGGQRDHPPPPPDWDQPRGPFHDGPGRPEDLSTRPEDSIYERLALLDAQNGALIAGSPRAEYSSIRRALTQKDKVIGYLAVAPMDTTATEAGRAFLTQQALFVLVISGVGYVLALLLSWGLAERWLKPIRHLTEGADAIAQGRLDTQIPVHGHDELSRLTITFNHMAQRLQQADQDHQHWLSEIAHELRTPLAAMRAEIEATMDGVRPLNPITIERLHRQILRLGQLVDDLRRSMEDTEAPVQRDPGVRPLEVLLETFALMQARFEQATLQVEAASVQSLTRQTAITMLASAAQLQQVFTNIFENTLRYTNAGGQVRVSAMLLRGQTQVRIRIEDSAPAPALADMPRLFERLYRGESSRDRSSGGSGLGLAICKHIIEAHGGSIRADDCELGGLCLEILLPVKCDDGRPF